MFFKRPEHVKPFVVCISSKHKSINFSFETEKDEQMPFLNIHLFRENGKFVTNVYRKETFTGVYTNFSIFMPLEHKFEWFIRYCIVAFAQFLICLSFTLKLKNLRK